MSASLIGLKEKAVDVSTWGMSLLGALFRGCCSVPIILLTDEIIVTLYKLYCIISFAILLRKYMNVKQAKKNVAVCGF